MTKPLMIFWICQWSVSDTFLELLIPSYTSLNKSKNQTLANTKNHPTFNHLNIHHKILHINQSLNLSPKNHQLKNQFSLRYPCKLLRLFSTPLTKIFFISVWGFVLMHKLINKLNGKFLILEKNVVALLLELFMEWKQNTYLHILNWKIIIDLLTK